MLRKTVNEGTRRQVLTALRGLQPGATHEVQDIANRFGMDVEALHEIAQDNGIALGSAYHQRPIGSTGASHPVLQVRALGDQDINLNRVQAQVEAHGIKFLHKPQFKNPDDPKLEWGNRVDAQLWAGGERVNLFEGLDGPLAPHAARFEHYRYPPAWIDRVVLSNSAKLGWLEHETLVQKYGEDIRAGTVPAVTIAQTKEAGQGLFAKETLPAGAFVGEYSGEIHVPDDEEIAWISERYRRFTAGRYEYDAKEQEYAFAYHPYSEFSSVPFSVIDAADTGNHTRFINHDSEPNLDVGYIFLDGMWHTIMVTNREIKPGEQLSFDYGQDYWNLRGITPKEL